MSDLANAKSLTLVLNEECDDGFCERQSVLVENGRVKIVYARKYNDEEEWRSWQDMGASMSIEEFMTVAGLIKDWKSC
jgi:hypothetical protein